MLQEVAAERVCQALPNTLQVPRRRAEVAQQDEARAAVSSTVQMQQPKMSLLANLRRAYPRHPRTGRLLFYLGHLRRLWSSHHQAGANQTRVHLVREPLRQVWFLQERFQSDRNRIPHENLLATHNLQS